MPSSGRPSSSKEPSAQFGQKREVSKKEMLALTNKNYELLPEVRQKREQQQKKDELKQRMKMAKEADRKRLELMKQKK